MKVASPTVNEAIREFLAEQADELGPEEHSNLSMVITLIPDALDGYAYESLSKEEGNFWRERWEKDEEAGSYSNTFGPEKIIGYLQLFLDWFLIRKVAGPAEMMDAAGWAARRLIDWLERKAYVSAADAHEARGWAEAASKDLPRAERLGELLYAKTREILEEPVVEHQDWMDERAIISKVEPRRMWFRLEEGELEIGPVHLPLVATELAETGWKVSALHLARTERAWRILEVGNVYPR